MFLTTPFQKHHLLDLIFSAPVMTDRWGVNLGSACWTSENYYCPGQKMRHNDDWAIEGIGGDSYVLESAHLPEAELIDLAYERYCHVRRLYR